MEGPRLIQKSSSIFDIFFGTAVSEPLDKEEISLPTEKDELRADESGKGTRGNDADNADSANDADDTDDADGDDIWKETGSHDEDESEQLARLAMLDDLNKRKEIARSESLLRETVLAETGHISEEEEGVMTTQEDEDERRL